MLSRTQRNTLTKGKDYPAELVSQNPVLTGGCFMQHNATKYFALARTEEMAGHDAPAILFYLASFCASLNCCDTQTLYRTTAKIQRLQARISLPDESLIAMVHSYGPLSDEACQLSLLQSLSGELPAVLT